MFKIFLTVRNRLEITKKCFQAIEKHTTQKHQIYVYDNSTTHNLDEHFDYFRDLYKNNKICQVSFTSDTSTFKAFSKAATCNFFGSQHEFDPQKDKYDFLVFLDNDIIVLPQWDITISNAWKDVKNLRLKNIKIITQIPGGVKFRKLFNKKIANKEAYTGKLGGSALWTVRPDFFRDVGYLDLSKLTGFYKKHDQYYWQLLDRASGNLEYAIALKTKLGLHCGSLTGSVCNRLTKTNDINKIKFEEMESKLKEKDFDTFFSELIRNKTIISGW